MHLKPLKIYCSFGSYVWLMLLAPVLNRYVESAGKREFALFLAVFFFFICGMEWCMSASNELQQGYSTLFLLGYIFWDTMFGFMEGAGVNCHYGMTF